MNVSNGCQNCKCYNCKLECEHKCGMITDKGYELETVMCVRNNKASEKIEELKKIGYIDLYNTCKIGE